MDCISSFDSMTKLIAALLALIPYDGMTGGYKKKNNKVRLWDIYSRCNFQTRESGIFFIGH